jgi:hypothetical protein
MTLRSEKAEEAEIARLDKLIATLDSERRDARKTHLIGVSWPVFIRKMRVLSAQSWSNRVESWVRQHHNWDKVDASLAAGDAVSEWGNQEIKVSMITPTNTSANFVQIRPHHAVAGYQLFVIEADYSLTHLSLTAKQMEDELDRGGHLAHGTRGQDTESDPHCEYALRIPWSEDHPARKHFMHYAVGQSGAGESCCVGVGAAAG